MLRVGMAGIGGLILVFIEVFMVMKLKGYYSIEIGGIAPFVSVWSMNFFFLFTLFTHISMWAKTQTDRKTNSTYL